ncbi:MAG: DUF5667 domain-containing protein [Marmoricola sp.]
MSPQLPSHRDAEEFARLLEGGGSTAVAERYADLVRTVTLLREQPRPEPRPEFVGDLRARLMAEADSVLLPAADAPRSLDAQRARRLGRRERHRGAAAAALVLVGATTGMAAAAQGSLPGQTLYPLKRGIESVEVHLSTSDATRGQQLLDQAATRLGEVRALVEQPATPQSADLVRATLDDFTSSADEGSRLLFSSYQQEGDDADIATVRDFTHGTMNVLTALVGSSPAGTAVFTSAGQTLAAIDQQARVLCQGCSNAAPLTVPRALIDLTSAAALHQLVSGPAEQVAPRGDLAQRVRDEAERAQKAANGTARPSSGGAAPATGTPTSRPSSGPTGSPFSGMNGSGDDQQPLRQLLGGVTTALPGVGGAVSGTTDGLKKTTDGLGGTLDSTLGTVGGTVGGTVDGVTGLLDGGATSK